MKVAGGWGSEGATWQALTSSSASPTLYPCPSLHLEGHSGTCTVKLRLCLLAEYLLFRLPLRRERLKAPQPRDRILRETLDL